MDSYLIITLLLLISTVATSDQNSQPSVDDFILTSCKPTKYPSLCIKSLSAYSTIVRSSPHQLAHVAVTLTANRALQTSTYLSSFSQSKQTGPLLQGAQPLSGPVQDCLTTMSNSAALMQKAMKEMRLLEKMVGNPSYGLRLGNVQTWMSAALTDQSTCLLGLLESGSSKVDDAVVMGIRKKVAELSWVTCNALSLVNHLASGN